MKYIQIGASILFIYLFYQLIAYVVTLLNWNVPPSIVGMILLLILLQIKVIPDFFVRKGASIFTRHLSFFFLPATLGLMTYPTIFSGEIFLVVVISIIGSVVVMMIVGIVNDKLIQMKEKRS